MIWLTMQKLTFVPSYWDPCTMDHISEDLFPDPYDESFCIGSTNLSSEKSLQHQQKYVRYFQRPLQDRSASHHPAPLRKRAGSRCSPAWWLVHAYTYTYTYTYTYLPNIHTYMHYFLSFFLTYLLTSPYIYIMYTLGCKLSTLAWNSRFISLMMLFTATTPMSDPEQVVPTRTLYPLRVSAVSFNLL